MKTAISIPDETFEAAERLAQRQGRSRSELYATAVREYLKRNGHDDLTARIDAAIEGQETRPDAFFQALSARALGPSEDW
jgi:predicted transcriptional regulator